MTSPLFDESNPVHAKALRMLERDLIAWFTTIGRDGRPRAVPVWFFWNDGQVFVISEPHTAKVSHVRRGAPVLIHLQTGTRFGNDVVILGGTAKIGAQSTVQWLPTVRHRYLQKYSNAVADYGIEIDDIAEQFSTLIVFTPDDLKVW